MVFDIESNDWRDYVVGGIFDGSTFRSFRSLSGLCDALDRYRGYKIFAHFGGIFDFLFLLNHWGAKSVIEGEFVMRGSSIFSFERGSNKYYDSAGIFPYGLERVTKAFGVEYQKLEWDHSKKKRITPELLKYLEYDCRGLYECIEKFYAVPLFEGVNFKPTLASQSLEVLRKYIPVSIPSINNKEVEKFVRSGYAGGRTEVFRPFFQDQGRKLNYYDFVSLYPSVLREMEVPGSLRTISKNVTPHSFVDCTVTAPKDCHLPLLWKKDAEKFLFPTGTFRGVFPGPELIEAEELGYTIEKVHRSMEFHSLGKIFTRFIDDLFYLKNTATDPVQRENAKFLLNAGGGRIGIKREREKLTLDDGSTNLVPLGNDVYLGPYRLMKKPDFFRGFSNVAIPAMMTAHARLKWHRMARRIQPENLYYADTDSIITSEILPTGTGLGELKLEGSENQACFLLPKAYIFGKKAVLKGFPKEFAQSLNFQDFTQALEGELKIYAPPGESRMMRIKSAYGTEGGDILKVVRGSARRLVAEYDKRTIFKTGGEWFTRPVQVSG